MNGMVSERHQERIQDRHLPEGGTLEKTTGDNVRHLEKVGRLGNFQMKIAGHVIHYKH